MSGSEMSEEQPCSRRSCWECVATTRSCWSCGLGATVTAWCDDPDQDLADLSALLVAAAH